MTVYVDPSLLTPSGLQDAAALLARRAEDLAALGSVEIVVAEPGPRRTLADAGDPATVRQALDRLAGEGGSAGELTELRYELLDAAQAGGAAGAATQLADRLLGEERSLLTRARSGLLDHLAHGAVAGPRLLILVSDGFDSDPAAFYRSHIAEQETLSPEPAANPGVVSWDDLTRATAAAGWLALPLSAGEPGPALDDPLGPLSGLAAATGGRLIRGDRDLQDALRAVRSRLSLRLRVPNDPSGLPHRLEVAARHGGPALSSPRWAAAALPDALSLARARRAATEPHSGSTVAPLVASVREERAPQQPSLRLVATAAVPPLPAGQPAPIYRLTAIYDLLDAPPIYRQELFVGLPGAPLRFELSTPGEDLRAAGVVLEELTGNGWWVATRALVEEEATVLAGAVPATPWSPPTELVRTSADPAPPAASRPAAAGSVPPAAPALDPAPTAESPAPTSGTSPPPVRGRTADRVIVLLPPRRAGLGRLGGSVGSNPTGKIRLETLVTRPDVARVVFFVDGQEVARDDRQPFSAVIDLGTEAKPRTLRADAQSAAGRLLGRSEIDLAAPVIPFRVTMTSVEGDPADGEVTVEADVSVPRDAELSRIEWYFNDTLADRQSPVPGTSRYRARVAIPSAEPTDFLRVVATLTDGTSIEDARLLSERGGSEQVEVNLVQLFAVVTDRAGTPLTGLGADDFSVRLGDTELSVERFRLAEEVPLLLGLLVDTSESMWPLLPDTKRAAARFLSDTLNESDQAFLVSFDDQPRLVRQPTADLLELLSGFGALRATGRTALYDAIVFSLLQMEGDRGRRALVLLTDGRDWGSRYGPRRATEYGQKLGVPVYILSFGDLYGDRRPLPQPDLDAVTARTGGQVFYIQRLEELTSVYARIAEELRSQYILAVATDRPLSADELERIEVDAGRGRKVRAAIGGSDLN